MKRKAWRDVKSLSGRDRALCEVAEKLSATPAKMIPADWDPLRELGLSDEAILEVVHIVGIFNHLTRLADGLGLQLERETVEASESGLGFTRP